MLLVFALAGALAGWIYFRLMWHSVLCMTERKAGMRRFVAFALLRILIFGGGLFAAFLTGGWCVLTYVLGFIVVRTVAVGKARATALLPNAPGNGKHDD